MLDISPISSHLGFGRYVRGLVESDLADEAVRRTLNAIWNESGLLIFRDCHASPEFQIALSRLFGDLEQHPVREYRVEGHPELIGLRADEFLYQVDGKVLGGWIPWHIDTVYTKSLCRGGLLRALKVPAEGGETGLADRAEAYAALPESMKKRIEKLEIVYRFSNDLAELPYCSSETFERIGKTEKQQAVQDRQKIDFRRFAYPLVYTPIGSDRRVLNISPMFAVEILGLAADESDALIRDLIAHATDPARVYLHEWKQDDMVLWDNWRMMHKACGTPDTMNREMHRTTIAGDWELGRELQ